MKMTVPLEVLDAQVELLQRTYHIVSVTTDPSGDTAEVVYEARGNRAAGDVETRA